MLDRAQFRQSSPFRTVFFLLLAILVLGAVVFLYFRAQRPILRPSPGKLAGSPYPAQILNLAHWKITMPLPDKKNPKNPLQIMQPELATYNNPPWFTTTSDSKGVLFRAPVNGVTTSGSSYPRSELRETTGDGTQDIFWSSTSGTHTLFLEEAVTAVPKKKPEVVAGQIHGDDNDLIVIRLDYPKLYIARGKNNLATLDENYTLGKRFTVKFVAKNGEILAYYNGSSIPAYTLEKRVSEAYFKVGAYTQSNCETESDPNLCDSDNYGEVAVYQATVTHQ